MNNGYQDYFKNAKKAADTSGVKVNIKSSAKNQKPQPKIRASQTSQEFALDFKQKTQQNARRPKRKAATLKLAVVSMMGIVVTGACFLYLPEIEKVYQKVEISLFSIAGAEEPAPAGKVVAAQAQADKKDDKATPATDAKAVAPAETAKPEPDLSYLGKLNERKSELDHREEELNRVEAELENQKQVLDKKLKDLEDMRKNISGILEERVQTDDKKVDALVAVYSDMKPEQAAKVFETMDEDLAVEIIGKMKKKNAAEVMNLMKPEKAQLFSEKFAGYKRK